MRYGGVAAFLASVAASCVVADLDYAGKRCTESCPDGLACVDGICTRDVIDGAAGCPEPCPDDQSCVNGACVPPEDEVGSRCTDSCSGGLTCVDGACARVDSRVHVSGFHVDWATPNAIRWGWTMHGNGPELESYELTITSASSTAPGVKVWTSKDSAELGGYQLKRSSGFDIVDGSITYDLDPQTSYTAQLTVHDTFGGTFVTAPVRGSTDAPRQSRVQIFAGALPSSAFLLPTQGFVVAQDGGVDGGPSLQYTLADDPDGSAGKFQNLRISGAKLTFDASLTPKLFATAYLELWVRGHGTPTSTWSELWLRIDDDGDGGSPCAANGCVWTYPGKWVYHPDPLGAVYRRVQVPLAAFKHRLDRVPLSVEDVRGRLTEVNVGCPYLDETDRTEIDRISISW